MKPMTTVQRPRLSTEHITLARARYGSHLAGGGRAPPPFSPPLHISTLLFSTPDTPHYYYAGGRVYALTFDVAGVVYHLSLPPSTRRSCLVRYRYGPCSLSGRALTTSYRWLPALCMRYCWARDILFDTLQLPHSHTCSHLSRHFVGCCCCETGIHWRAYYTASAIHSFACGWLTY